MSTGTTFIGGSVTLERDGRPDGPRRPAARPYSKWRDVIVIGALRAQLVVRIGSNSAYTCPFEAISSTIGNYTTQLPIMEEIASNRHAYAELEAIRNSPNLDHHRLRYLV